MPTYFDPITLDDLEIDASTIMYLVAVNMDLENPQMNTYRIKGISSGLNLLRNDPYTTAEHYWSIDTGLVLANANNKQWKLVFFPIDNKLTTKPVSIVDIERYLSINPNNIASTPFRRQLGRDAATNMILSQLDLQRAVDLGEGGFTLDDLDIHDPVAITNLLRPESTAALREGLITAVDLLNFNRDHFLEFLELPCLSALRDGLFSGDDIASMDPEKQLELIHPECLQALREKRTLIALLKRLSAEQLRLANHARDYPPVPVPDLLLLAEPLRSRLLPRINEIAHLIHGAGMYLPDLIELDETKRESWILRAEAISTLVTAGISLDELLGLEQDELKIFTEYRYTKAIIELVTEKNISIEHLSGLAVDRLTSDLNEYINHGSFDHFFPTQRFSY